MPGFTSHESNANEVLLATGVTVSPIQPVGISNGGHGTLACAAVAGQVRCLGFPNSSGAGTKVEGSGLFTHVNLRTSGRIQDDSWAWTPGLPVYVSTTAGGLTQTAPSTTNQLIQSVGLADRADQIVLNIDTRGSTV
jgi:hypothetical protein